MSRAVIITSYIEAPVDIKGLLRDDDHIVCLDGGYDIALKQGIRPHVLLGDFDSLRSELPDEGVEVIEYPPEKDHTDLELSLRVLDPKKNPELLIVGGIGGRLDHTAINLQLIGVYTDDPDRSFRLIEMMDGNNRCFPVHGTTSNNPGRGAGRIEIQRADDNYLSLIPLTDICEGVTLTGVK